MIIIPDANSIISALIKRGKALDLFEWNDFRKEIRFIAPENLSSEIRRNMLEILDKSKISESDIMDVLDKIESQMEFIPFSKFERFISRALEVSPPNDFVYTALALFLKSEGIDARVLSNDKGLLAALSKIGLIGIALHELLRELKIA